MLFDGVRHCTVAGWYWVGLGASLVRLVNSPPRMTLSPIHAVARRSAVIWQMIGVGIRDRERRPVGRKQRAHPEAGEGDVGLHVHPVGAVVGTGDVAEARVIEVSDVAPERRFDLCAEIADPRG